MVNYTIRTLQTRIVLTEYKIQLLISIFALMVKKKAKKKKGKKRPTNYEKPLTTKGKLNFGELVGLAMSGNPKGK
jgi:hypothetical protein